MHPLIEAWQDGGRIFDLGRPMREGIPKAPTHPPYRQVMSQRHGDLVRPGGTSSAADTILTGTHTGTHVDAIGHISGDGCLNGGLDASQTQRGGRLAAHGIEEFAPLVSRGVMLDVPRLLGVECLPPDHEVTANELQAAADRQATPIGPGDAVLIRTGWGAHFDDPDAFVGEATGTPGPGTEAASWLGQRGVTVVGGETIAFERLVADGGVHPLAAHRVLLVDHGVHILEVMDLAPLADAEVFEFLLVLAPLKLVGATGSPLRPLALA